MDKYKFTGYQPCTIAVYTRDGKELLREESLVAVDSQQDTVLAVGKRARQEAGKGDYIKVGSPLRNGAVADYEIACSLFSILLQKANGRRFFTKPRITICAPVDMSPVEYKALNEAFLAAGVKSMLIVEETFQVAAPKVPATHHLVVEIVPSE